MASRTTRSALLVSALMMVGAACGGSDDTTEPAEEAPASSPATTTTTTDPGDPAASSEPATTRPATTAPPTTPAETTPAETNPATSDAPPTTPPATGTGTAVVDVGGDRYEFRVIQCLRDQPSVFGDTIIEITLDGVPPDTPQELIEPLLGVTDPDTDLLPLVEPVAAYGPLLTVSRFEGGGDYVVVYDLDAVEIVSDPDPLAPGSRFLDVSDGDVGATISGSTTGDGGTPLTLSVTCP